MPDFHVSFRILLHAVNLRHGTDGFTSPPKGAQEKIQRLRPGLNPRTWVPKASTLPLDHRSRSHRTLVLLMRTRNINCELQYRLRSCDDHYFVFQYTLTAPVAVRKRKRKHSNKICAIRIKRKHYFTLNLFQ